MWAWSRSAALAILLVVLWATLAQAQGPGIGPFPPGVGPPGQTLRMLTVLNPNPTSGIVTATGISCGSTCTHNYVRNATITLTATTVVGATFNGWTGACASSGTASTCVLKMNQAQTVGVTFSAIALSYKLAWDDNSFIEANQTLERRSPCNGAFAFAPLATIAPNVQLYTDTAVTAGVTYQYRLLQTGPGGATSGYTNVICTSLTAPPTDPGAPVIGTFVVGATTTLIPVTWSASLEVPSGNPVLLYQWNGGYTDAAIVSSTPTNQLSLVIPNRAFDSNGYFCVQGQDSNGVLSVNQSCTGFFVPAVLPSTGTTIAETFPTNGAITSGQDLTWTNTAGSSMAVATGAAVETVDRTDGQSSHARAESPLATADQVVRAQVVFSMTDPEADVELVARMSATSDSGYTFLLYTNDSGNHFQVFLQKIVNGIAQVLPQAPVGVDVTASMASTNIMTLVVQGTSPTIRLTGLLNGRVVHSAVLPSDAENLAANRRIGIGAYKATGNVRIDNVSARDFATPYTTAGSCQQDDVALAIAYAVDGDTVTIPAGQCTIANGTAWTGHLSISKRLTIQGAGDGTGSAVGCGNCTTVIQDNRDPSAVDCCQFQPTQILIWTVPATGLSQLSGISWLGNGGDRGGTQFSPSKGMLAFQGDGSQKQFRLHHNKFAPRGTVAAAAGFSLTNLFGVVDHNTCDLLVGQSPCVYVLMPTYLGAGNYGDNSWAQPSTLGTDNATYFENNDFFAPPAGSTFQFSADGWQGNRVVYRNNTFRNVSLSNHGLDSGGRIDRSQRHAEVYDNTILIETGHNVGATWSGFRGGTGMIFNNAMTMQAGGSLTGVVDASVLRASPTSCCGPGKDYTYFGRCGANAINISSSGTTVTVTVTDTDRRFNSDVAIRITNASPSGYNGIYTGITPTSLTTAQFTGPNLGPGTGTITSPWDQNSDSTGYACADQAGRGQGVNWNGALNPPIAWPNQALEPMYVWGNTSNGSPSPIFAEQPPQIVANRDYYNNALGLIVNRPLSCTPSQGYYATDTKILYQCQAPNTWVVKYQPLTYPHPLVSGIGPNTVQAAGCSQQQISDAIALPQVTTGWTVQVPAGPPCTWTGVLNVNKAITLQGAGIGQTVITDARVLQGDNTRNIIQVNVVGGSTLTRITGFTFQGDGVQAMISDGLIKISGCSTTTANYRIDNNRFLNIRNGPLRMFGNVYGVTDHNTFDGLANSIFVSADNLSWPRDGVTCTGQFGDGSWAFPLEPGSIKAHYIETNTINGVGVAPTGILSSIVDSNNGARTVVRNNTLVNAGISSHGTDGSSRLRGNRWIESYDNTITIHNNDAGNQYSIDFVAWYRGGSGVFYNNTVTVDNRSLGLNWLLKYQNRRDAFDAGAPWHLCDGSQPYDGNTSGQTGYRCLDQPGAGTAVDWLDVNPAPSSAAGNTLEPIYAWNNSVNGNTNDLGTFGSGGDGHVHVGRDIFFSTSATIQRPGYTPLAYPHPLVTP